MGQKRSVSARNGKNIHIWDHQYADGAPLGRGCGVLTRVPRGWEKEWPLSHKSSWVSRHKHFWADISFNFSAFGDVLKFNRMYRFEFNRPLCSGSVAPGAVAAAAVFSNQEFIYFRRERNFVSVILTDSLVVEFPQGSKLEDFLKSTCCSFIALPTTY